MARKPATKKAAPKKAATKKAVAKTNQSTAMAPIDLGADAGLGMENTDAESFAIPFLNVIQSNSPQVIEGEAEFIPEARPGMFVNSVTEELYDGKEGILFIPCAFRRRFIRWGARKQGGGFKGEYSAEQVEAMRIAGEVKDLNGRLYCPTEHGVLDPDISDNVKDTRNHFGLVWSEQIDGWQGVLMSLASTQIKKSRALMTMLNMIKVPGIGTPPTFYNVVSAVTVPESNDEGNWHGVKFTMHSDLGEDPEAYNQAKEFYKLISSGQAEVNYNTQSSAEPGEGQF